LRILDLFGTLREMKDTAVFSYWNGRVSKGLLPVLVCILLLTLICSLVNEWPSPRTLSRPARTEVHAMVRTLYAAIDEFQRDYDRFPLASSSTEGKDTDSDSGPAEGLAAALLGIDETLNHRKANYLGDIKDAHRLDGEHLKNGLVRKNDTAAIVDPWGRPYHIHLDSDGDGLIADPRKGSVPLKQKVLVWSDGKDGDPDTWEDNVTSWD
jgi:hypothetical protein